MTKEEHKEAENKSSGDTAKNESDAAKAVETSDTGTSAVPTEKDDEDSLDEQPSAKRNKPEEKPLKTSSMTARTVVTDDSSTEILNLTTTHDLRDTAVVREVTDDLLTPLSDAIADRNNSLVYIQFYRTPNENPGQTSPQLSLALSLQVKSNTKTTHQQKPKEDSTHAPHPGQTVTAFVIQQLDEILEKKKANLPNIALSFTIELEEPPFSELSAAEKAKRIEERKDAKADLLTHFATHDTLNAKKLMPLYRKFLYAVDKQETPQEQLQVSTLDDIDNYILDAESSDEDEEEEDEGEVEWEEDENETFLQDEDSELKDEDEFEEEENLENDDYEEEEEEDEDNSDVEDYEEDDDAEMQPEVSNPDDYYSDPILTAELSDEDEEEEYGEEVDVEEDEEEFEEKDNSDDDDNEEDEVAEMDDEYDD